MADPLFYDLDFLPPGRVTAPRFLGGAVEGGTALSGSSVASDVTGGGLIAVDYFDIQLGNRDPGRMRYYSRLAAALSTGVRKCVVPLLTDFWAPITGNSLTGGGVSPKSTFDDGAVFSDGSTFSQPPVAGKSLGDWSAGASTLNLTVVGGRALEGGEWFGVQHLSKSFRAYCVTDVVSLTSFPNGNFNASVNIRPPLRDVVKDGQVIDWWRPRCLMRIAPGFSPDLDIGPAFWSTPSLKFVEAY